MNLSSWLIVIPARLKSERLPRKPLADLKGRPLLARVYDNLKPLEKNGARILAAIDHSDTQKMCEQFKIPFQMTSEDHPSGTDRCLEVAQANPGFSYVLNVQGDEPFVSLDDLGCLMMELEKGGHQMGTLGFTSSDRNLFINPNVVKIAMTSHRIALYFSRAPIPFDRDGHRDVKKQIQFTQHLGVYAFRASALKSFCQLPVSPLEQTEKLEQLRAVENGWNIYVASASSESIGIDTPEDLLHAQGRFQ